MTTEATAYAETLVTFRDLLDDCDISLSNEYVRGGVNLIADLFGIVERDTGERMEDIVADLRKTPMHADFRSLEQYGVAPYVHDPDGLTVTTNDVAHILGCMGYGDWSAQVLEGHAAGDRWFLPREEST